MNLAWKCYEDDVANGRDFAQSYKEQSHISFYPVQLFP